MKRIYRFVKWADTSHYRQFAELHPIDDPVAGITSTIVIDCLLLLPSPNLGIGTTYEITIEELPPETTL